MAVGACDLGLANATLAAGGERPFWEAFFSLLKIDIRQGQSIFYLWMLSFICDDQSCYSYFGITKAISPRGQVNMLRL